MSPDQAVSGRWIRRNSTFSNSVFSSWLFFLHSSFSTLCRCGQVKPRLLLLHVELWVMKTTDVKQGLRCPLVVNFVSSKMNTDQFYPWETEVKLKRRCVTWCISFSNRRISTVEPWTPHGARGEFERCFLFAALRWCKGCSAERTITLKRAVRNSDVIIG